MVISVFQGLGSLRLSCQIFVFIAFIIILLLGFPFYPFDFIRVCSNIPISFLILVICFFFFFFFFFISLARDLSISLIFFFQRINCFIDFHCCFSPFNLIDLCSFIFLSVCLLWICFAPRPPNQVLE